MPKIIAAVPTTMIGMGMGISRLSAAPMPPRSAAACVFFEREY